MTEMIGICHDIVGFVASHRLVNEALQAKQKDLWPHSQPICLVQDVSTRWNSTLSMVVTVSNLFSAIVAVLTDSSVIAPMDWDRAQALASDVTRVGRDLPVLARLYDPLRIVSNMAESSIGTLSACIPLVAIIEAHLSVCGGP